MATGSHNARRAMYERWVRDHGAEVYRFAHRACGDAEVAEDLVQETFYEAWKCMNRLREPERARAWLFQILRHRYSRWVRTERRSPVVGAVTLDAAAGVSISENAGESNPADRDLLQVALNKVSDVLKVPLLMVFLEGLTCQETANRMDLPLGTVLSRIHRAKRQLRTILRDEQIEPVTEQEPSRRYRIGGDS